MCLMQYDRFQKQAFDFINQGYSVIVSAPTGAGKTVIAEHVITECLKKNSGVIYTAPIKALSNQKFRDFQGQYPDKIGILTGDVSINPEAPVLIMTTEIFRNKALEESQSLKKYAWIIFDEIHYIDNEERGTIWEESIMFLPAHMKMLCLSATVPNIDALVCWIESVHNRDLKKVIETKRPVPLHFFFQCQNQILDSLSRLRRGGYQKQISYSYRGRQRFTHISFRPNRLATLLHHLQQQDALPCIYFAFGRRRCETLANELYSFNFLNNKEQEKITLMYQALCERFDLTQEKSAGSLFHLIKRGVAYHHAGMLPTLKEVIEQLFTSKLIKIIFTTETFALGINMPARTVVFDELRKFYGRYHQNLKTRDFYQMAGRAGRRGMDQEGFVYCRINPRWIEAEEVKRILYANPEKISSKFNSSYATLLHLYAKHKENLYQLYPLTLHYFQEKPRRRKKAKELLQAKISLLKELGYIRNQELTAKGEFAASLYGFELPIAEIFAQNILERLSQVELGILATALVYEPRKGDHTPKLTPNARALKAITDEIHRAIQRLEQRLHIWPKSKEYFFHLALVTEAWLRGEEFSQLSRYSNVDEGELVRYFRMATQVLREIQHAPVTSEQLKERIRKLLLIFNRDIVDAEKQLRIEKNFTFEKNFT
ncbi:MAG: DEAD/DEAH box helicase [Candidatus Omnitrophica bacterium]|nr:DEAD/DEAH box helicase [Candidatus Omnitrophota bacterium]